MRMSDIIIAKKKGGQLSQGEISWFIAGYTKGDIPDYQISALLMAINFQGMTPQETAVLTEAMALSGDVIKLDDIAGIKVDKHSTGGVGDKTTLIVGPIVAACSVPVAKMSGRGLGHTGGTVDKLEGIPGLRTELSKAEFIKQVKDVGIAVIGQSANIAPADKKLYALRDVTGTVESIPLIASSIMSKKIAAGADAIVLDVKTGKGAFMETLEGSLDLAQAMVAIGKGVGRKTTALVTDMNEPLGLAVGNNLEVAEAVATLKGKGPADLRLLSIELAANMLFLAGQEGIRGNIDACRQRAKEVLDSGLAYEKLKEMVAAQGGDTACLDNTQLLPQGPLIKAVAADAEAIKNIKGNDAGDGCVYVTEIDALSIGKAAAILGAGRQIKDEAIDHRAGIMLKVKVGAEVFAGQVLAELYTNDEVKAKEAAVLVLAAIKMAKDKPKSKPLIYCRITEDNQVENLELAVPALPKSMASLE